MAKRKITIEEALAALREAGLDVEVSSVVDEPVVKQPDFIVEQPDAKKSSSAKKGSKSKGGTVTVRLFCSHSIGSGGFMSFNEGQKSVEQAGYVVYGPGVCEVPEALASSLRYQDMMARKQDERMLDPTQRCFFITEKFNGVVRSNVPVEVESLDDLTNMVSMRIVGNGT